MDQGAFECKEIEAGKTRMGGKKRKGKKVRPMRIGGRFERKRKTTRKMVVTYITGERLKCLHIDLCGGSAKPLSAFKLCRFRTRMFPQCEDGPAL